MKVQKSSHQEGRTIVETLGYIMVMIAVTVSFAAAVSRGYYRYESSAIQQELSDLKKVITIRYAADGHYNNVKWDDLCADKAGPKSLMPSIECDSTQGCKCKVQRGRHSFDGPVDIGPADCSVQEDDDKETCLTYFIEFRELPKDICAQLASKAWDNMEGSDLERMVVSQGSNHQAPKTWVWQFSPISEEQGDKELPPKMTDIVDACSSKYDNTITWYFN